MSRAFFSSFFSFLFCFILFLLHSAREAFSVSFSSFLLLHRAQDVSGALFSSFYIILLSSWALVLFFNYPFYFPGPQMHSQRVLGPLFHHFLNIFIFPSQGPRRVMCLGPLF